MICEVLEMVGGVALQPKVDQGWCYSYTWTLQREGAAECIVRLRVFKDAKQATGLAAAFVPLKEFAAAPNLKAVACVSSPLDCADAFNTGVKQALADAEARAAKAGWVDSYLEVACAMPVMTNMTAVWTDIADGKEVIDPRTGAPLLPIVEVATGQPAPKAAQEGVPPIRKASGGLGACGCCGSRPQA